MDKILLAFCKMNYLSVKLGGNAGEDQTKNASLMPLAFLPESKTEIWLIGRSSGSFRSWRLPGR
jgi:hypothetical protein